MYAIYFCKGESQADALRRIIGLHMAGVHQFAKVTPQDKDGAELKSRYAAEDQMIIVISSDDKELARFSQQTSESEFTKWRMSEGASIAGQK